MIVDVSSSQMMDVVSKWLKVFKGSSWFNTAGNIFILIILLRVIVVSMVFDECLEKAESTIKPAFCFFLSFDVTNKLRTK